MRSKATFAVTTFTGADPVSPSPSSAVPFFDAAERFADRASWWTTGGHLARRAS